MYLKGISAAFVGVFFVLTSAATFNETYETQNETELASNNLFNFYGFAFPFKMYDNISAIDFKNSVASEDGRLNSFSSLFGGPVVTSVTTCRSSPSTELVTDTIFNTMTFYNTYFATETFHTTNIFVKTFFTTLTTTKTLDDQWSVSYRVTDYKTTTATETEVQTIPAQNVHQTMTTLLTSTQLFSETSTVTDVHLLKHFDHITETSLSTTIVEKAVPVYKTSFVTLKPITKTLTNVAVVSETETGTVSPFTAVEYTTEIMTTTLVRVEWIAPETSTYILSLLIPDIRYRSETEYDSIVVTSYHEHQIYRTSTILVFSTLTNYQHNTNTHIVASTYTHTSTLTREVVETIYSDIVTTTLVPSFSVRTMYDQVTSTKTHFKTMEIRSTTTMVLMNKVSAISFTTLEPSTIVNTFVVTPLCTISSSAEHALNLLNP